MAGTPIKRARRERTKQLMDSQDFWTQLWEHMAEGHSLRSFISGSDISYNTVWSRIQNDPELSERFEMVRNVRAMQNAERIEALAEKVEQEQIDPNAARVSINARQWLAERMDPKRWGNKIQQDIKLTDTTQLHLEAVRNLMRTVSVQEPEKLTSDTPMHGDPDARGSSEAM